jgi:hypothetical protein
MSAPARSGWILIVPGRDEYGSALAPLLILGPIELDGFWRDLLG